MEKVVNLFELYADGKGLIISEGTTAATKQRWRAMLLHLAGPDVEEIFTTFNSLKPGMLQITPVLLKLSTPKNPGKTQVRQFNSLSLA